MVQNNSNETQNTWMPSLKWLGKTFAIILVFVIVAFFALNFLLKPYMRNIPSQITPWLDNNSTKVSEQK